jgi:hypothetical protein
VRLSAERFDHQPCDLGAGVLLLAGDQASVADGKWLLCVNSAPQKPTGIPNVVEVAGLAITIRILVGLAGLVTSISPLIPLPAIA